MQYFGTAQGTVVTAIITCCQADGDTIHLFPALPSAWDSAAFENLLAAGLEVSAALAADGGVTCTVRNIAPGHLVRRIVYRGTVTEVVLEPGAEQSLALAKEGL
jgi:hypothetical protein